MKRMMRSVIVLILLIAILPGCGPAKPGAVSGQIKFLNADGAVQNVPGAQVILRGAQDTRTAVSTSGDGDQPDATYNYLIDAVTAGSYVMAVTPPAGSGLQPESDISLQVKSGETYAQSVLLLPEGVAKPRPLTPAEASNGETGYVNSRGERVVYGNSGPDFTDFAFMYLLFRNPGYYGYSSPPVIINNPGSSSSSGSRYRVEPPPSTTSRGDKITQTAPSVPGQGATRPGSAPASGSSNSGSSGSSSSGSSPSQGVSRPSAPSSSSSGSSSRSSGSSGSSSRSSGSSSGGRK